MSNRLVDLVPANINFANMLALVGAILYVTTLMMRTIVPLRVVGILSMVFFIAYGALAGAGARFLLRQVELLWRNGLLEYLLPRASVPTT